jgi:hypothetical protein
LQHIIALFNVQDQAPLGAEQSAQDRQSAEEPAPALVGR